MTACPVLDGGTLPGLASRVGQVAYPYEDLDDSQFERLVVEGSRPLFGPGLQAFAAGPDGGRDARFNGTANNFPSAAQPWTGITVIQAKHTNATNAHFSDSDFSSDAKTSVLTEELERIKKLVQAGELNNYLLFSNRRLGAIASTTIVTRIAAETGLDPSRVFLAGTEYLDMLMREQGDLVRRARIDPIDGPLLVSSYDLAEVILAIAEGMDAAPPANDAAVVDRVGYDEKNRVNNLSPNFADLLRRRYLVLTRQIEEFLADPANGRALKQYEGAVEDFELKIVAKRADYQSFDDLFNYLIDFLLKRDGVLAANRRLTRAMVFYMYWHCDIGETADAQPK